MSKRIKKEVAFLRRWKKRFPATEESEIEARLNKAVNPIFYSIDTVSWIDSLTNSIKSQRIVPSKPAQVNWTDNLPSIKGNGPPDVAELIPPAVPKKPYAIEADILTPAEIKRIQTKYQLVAFRIGLYFDKVYVEASWQEKHQRIYLHIPNDGSKLTILNKLEAGLKKYVQERNERENKKVQEMLQKWR